MRITCLLGLIAVLFVTSLPAQALPGPQQGLRSQVAARPDKPTVSVLLSASHRHRSWQAGMIIGGVTGAGLALLYNLVFSDVSHKALRVFEFTVGGSIIGGLIGS